MGPVTDILISLLGIFLALDAVAHYTKYRYGETFSQWDKNLERAHMSVHVLNIALLVVLLLHLTIL